MLLFALSDEIAFPPPALATDEGLLAIGGDLSQERLLLAYRMGIFPWYSEGEPILWWSPDPRLVLAPEQFHVSRSLAKTLRRQVFAVTMDQAFRDVIAGCATTPRRGQDGTWITSEMIRAYCGLHEAGYAHSVECWAEGELAGGVYGIALGGCFFAESMFTRVTNASKVALATLAPQLHAWGFVMIDCQVTTQHVLSLGAQEIPRAEFLRRLEHGLKAETRRGKWALSSA